MLTLLQTGEFIKSLERFDEPVSSCVWTADGQTIIVGSFDRERALCQWTLEGERVYSWSKKHRTEDLALSPDGRWLIAMDEKRHIHVYNFMTRALEYEMDLEWQPTSISISQDSRYLLVNNVEGGAQLFNIASRTPVQTYTGQKGGMFLIRSALGGADENFAVSGSEGTAGFFLPW